MPKFLVPLSFCGLFLIVTVRPSLAEQQKSPDPELVAAGIFSREKEVAKRAEGFSARAELHLDVAKGRSEMAGRIDLFDISRSVRKQKWKLPGQYTSRLNAAGLVSPSPFDPETFNGVNFQLTFERIDSDGCYVFHVEAKKGQKWGKETVHFEGRIRVLPADSTIVRFDGLFVPSKKWTPLLREDFWFPIQIRRAEVLPDVWLPVEIITENQGTSKNRGFFEFKAAVTFRDFVRNPGPPAGGASLPHH